MATLWLKAGDETGDLIDFLASEIDDQSLDQIGVERELAPASGLASEPFTVAATLTLSTTAVIVVGRIIERWLEKRQQAQAMRLVAAGFRDSDEAGKTLAKLAEKYAQVSVTYSLLQVPKKQ